MQPKIYLLFFSGLLLLTSCELDNFQEPDAFFTGHIVYQGEPIPVARNQVWFELWQPGFGLSAPIDVAIAQDGSYSSRLFSGSYKLAFLPGEGPFKAPSDTIFLDLNGSESMELEVTPYYMIRSPQFSHSGGTISANCTVEQIITGADAKDVERVTLIVNRTLFVDANSGGEGSLAQANAADISDLSQVNLSVDIPDDEKKADQDYYFVRIGVKIAGVEDMIYTQVEKISL